MANTFEIAKRVRLLLPALLLLIASLAISCATTIPARAFLTSSDNSLNQWLDTSLNVDFAEVRVMHLPLTDAFTGMKLAITRADADVESQRVSLHADEITRRQALWLLTQKYGLQMAVENVPRPAFLHQHHEVGMRRLFRARESVISFAPCCQRC